MSTDFSENQIEEFSWHLPGLWKKIGSHDIMTLSTCAENRVTSRSMSMIRIDGKFYCQTDEAYLKFKQVSENPNVAICWKNFSIEGIFVCLYFRKDKHIWELEA